jgi:hypothetical protein
VEGETPVAVGQVGIDIGVFDHGGVANSRRLRAGRGNGEFESLPVVTSAETAVTVATRR